MSQRGQAVVEFTVCLVVLLLILLGGIFLFSLHNARREMVVGNPQKHTDSLRAQAGLEALDNPHTTSADYILDWTDGTDGQPGTADDKPMRGSANSFRQILNLGANDPADWDRLQDDHLANYDRPFPSIAFLRLAPMSGLEFVNKNDAKNVKVEPFLRQLLIPREEVTIKHEVWFPACSNLH